LFCAAVLVLGQDQQARIGEIEFFGYSGIDHEPVRAALPVHEGDTLAFSDEAIGQARTQIKQAVQRATGHDPTDIALVCCDSKGQWMIYIGLGGKSSTAFHYNAAPQGSAKLPPNIIKLYEEAMDANSEAVRKGAAGEDDSKGYALSEEPGYRSKQLAMRKYASRHEKLIRRVLESSAEASQRVAAAELLGYARQSKEQIAALVRASHDPDDGVRNNAIRALGVIARSRSVVAAEFPAVDFAAMLGLGSCFDWFQSVLLLERLSANRYPKLLSELRALALKPLLEMARWRSPGHSGTARMILGRIAGIDEKRLEEIVDKGEIQIILDTLRVSPAYQRRPNPRRYEK
jgi:hypothetical protein